ncbi:helix-turn-helix domain-containing protein [Parabacteroides faecis]|uniref:AraC-like DNA-binding protein n=1 Tax=Parabacteroides faecis TaxID=1217282 RepID=A0ABR6KUG5_9BACT|nr:helix-turn-helix domain-containing protein [Parabacteroides faecis]MBB4625155.1 AraC-like DNA-binding protein [Parabacteroides faecis]GGK18861.1 transcription regulator [Parabacteroides faecis]
MEIIDKHLHEKCFHFDKSELPLVELITAPKGKNSNLPIRTNEIVFFLEGELRFVFSDLPEYVGRKGHMVLLPAGGRYYFETLEDTVMLILRITKPIQICENLSIEKFYHHFSANKKKPNKNMPRFSTLDMNERIWHFVEGVANCLTDGVRCCGYFDLVVKEFILMLSVYYSKKEICDFLYYLSLSEDTVFEEHVRRQWHIYKNVEEIAESVWMTPRKFSDKFKVVFGQTPYSWMKENRAKLIKKELTTTDKLIKQIAFEQGFENKSQFTKFCKKELGANPTEIRAGKSQHV